MSEAPQITNETLCLCGHEAQHHNSVHTRYVNAELCRGITVDNGKICPPCKCECFVRADAGKSVASPVPQLLYCPCCSTLHVDEGEWATRPHTTHLCAACNHEWRPFECATVGVPEVPNMPHLNPISLRLTESEQSVARLRRELDEAQADLLPIRVLDAWAKKHRYSVPQVQQDPRPGTWTVFVRIGDERAWFTGNTPVEARRDAARALVAEDPELANA